MEQLRSRIFFLFLIFHSFSAFAVCLDQSGKILNQNNEQVLKWKTTTANQFLSRAHVEGTVMDIYPDHNGHNHFSINLDNDTKHNLEVVYNVNFGKLPSIKIGMKIEACGDYITSIAATSQYPP